ncbi:glycosyltransferase family 39 protein [Sphingomonas hylomeconis]|uniref:Glycosyltransferase family 39 protein n=1 Tax=Sphingomonas hylomeconis TaxID=1395958 RepID=A0ABV7SSW8_9SPHN|nr:glycosyltransferase family 39 protein [Sphingomonas hylomeconis]
MRYEASDLSGQPARAGAWQRRIWLVAAALIVALAAGRLAWLPVHAPLSVNEGWNAAHVVRTFNPDTLYPDPEALIANNYPPLSFLIVGLLSKLTGDAIIAGRLVALLAQIACGLGVAAIVGRLAPGRQWKVAGCCLFGAYCVTLLRSYVAINDPQWLGDAAMVWGVFFLVPRRAGQPPSLRSIAIAAALMVAGELIKHNLVAFPIAVTVWLALFERRALVAWIAFGAAFAAIACAGVFAIWGAIAFIDVLAPARSYSLARMLAKGGPLLLAMLPVLIASRPLLAQWRGDRRLALPIVLLAVAIPLGVVQRAGSGVDVNAFFETVIALSIAVPVATALRPQPSWRWIAISLLPALCLVPRAAAANWRELRQRDAAVRHAAPLIASLRQARGPVACDDQAYCYWAGRESGLDFFSVKQRLLEDRAQALTPALAEGRFALIVMRGHNPGWQENRLIPAIRAHYRTVHARNGIEMLVPKQGSDPRSVQPN